jgi:hypothetical protein
MWIVAQLGAREHYSIACALHAAGALRALITDFWVPPDSFWKLVPNRRLQGRFRPDLRGTPVYASNMEALCFEAAALLACDRGWGLIQRRNEWFQEQALAALKKLNSEMPKTGMICHRGAESRETVEPLAGPDARAKAEMRETERRPHPPSCSQPPTLNPQPTLFAYSFAARRVLEFARQQGWRTVLGQIDPGPPEERIVSRLRQQHPRVGASWAPAPPSYWENWREECRLADKIVVNSEWSRAALQEEGVPPEKLAVVPLAFEPPAEAEGFARSYPPAFTEERPLRVLFLGQVSLRKGVAELIEAVRLLRGRPVRFEVVGPLQVRVPEELRRDPQVHWAGPVARGAAAEHYRRADVFLFPTHSDGFGLTQLEAQAWRLPIVASRFCGDVVRDGANGLVLPEVTGAAVAAALERCLRDPGLLSGFAQNARPASEFSLARLAERLLAL